MIDEDHDPECVHCIVLQALYDYGEGHGHKIETSYLVHKLIEVIGDAIDQVEGDDHRDKQADLAIRDMFRMLKMVLGGEWRERGNLYPTETGTKQ